MCCEIFYNILNMLNFHKFLNSFWSLCLLLALAPSTISAASMSQDDNVTIGISCHNSIGLTSDNIVMTSNDEDEYNVKTFGDMDGDNDVDVSDIMLIVQLLLTKDDSNIDTDEADVNFDGEVTINDVMMLVGIVMGEDISRPVYAPLF